MREVFRTELTDETTATACPTFYTHLCDGGGWDNGLLWLVIYYDFELHTKLPKEAWEDLIWSLDDYDKDYPTLVRWIDSAWQAWATRLPIHQMI